MLMESRKRVGGEAAAGEESKMRGEARVEAAASYPIVLRSYEPAADLDERLRRILHGTQPAADERVNAPCDLTSGASRSGSTIGWAEPSLGIGSGGRFEISQGDSGLLEGVVRLADETA
jgi:hypothetical protein